MHEVVAVNDDEKKVIRAFVTPTSYHSTDSNQSALIILILCIIIVVEAKLLILFMRYRYVSISEVNNLPCT